MDNKMQEEYTGVCCWFSRGYGFITPDNGGADIFVHFSDISIEGYRTLQKGQKVVYKIGTNNRQQPKAIEVKPV